jgi:hypothetical protein
MVNRRGFLKFSTLGTASLASLFVASSSAQGADLLRKNLIHPRQDNEINNEDWASVWDYVDLIKFRPSDDPSAWDWTDAIQALLNRGGNIVLPEGVTYTTSNTLRMLSNTWLVVNGTLKFSDQLNTISTDHLLMCGDAKDPRENVRLSGKGIIDGNYQNRVSFAPTSGAYLFLARETTKLRIMPGLKFINAPSSAIVGVSCVDSVVEGADLRYIREHGIYFSTDSTGINLLSNSMNDLAVGDAYKSDAVKLRNNCSNFLIQGNTVNKSPETRPNVVRGVVLDESDNVSPINHAICHDGKILDNTMLGLSTGIWFKGSLVDAKSSDSFFDMRVEVARNTFEAKRASPLFAGILDRVRSVDLNDNTWRNFKSGVYGGGVGAIALRRNKIIHDIGASGDGIRMLDTIYKDTTTASRSRGDVTLIDNEVTGYNGVGALLTVADVHDKIKGNKIVSKGGAVYYRDYGLNTAPTAGRQVVDLSDNRSLKSTGADVAAISLRSSPKISVEYIVADNIVTSASVGIEYIAAQNSSANTNQIDAPIPLKVDRDAVVSRKGNFSSKSEINTIIFTQEK